MAAELGDEGVETQPPGLIGVDLNRFRIRAALASCLVEIIGGSGEERNVGVALGWLRDPSLFTVRLGEFRYGCSHGRGWLLACVWAAGLIDFSAAGCLLGWVCP